MTSSAKPLYLLYTSALYLYRPALEYPADTRFCAKIRRVWYLMERGMGPAYFPANAFDFDDHFNVCCAISASNGASTPHFSLRYPLDPTLFTSISASSSASTPQYSLRYPLRKALRPHFRYQLRKALRPINRC